MGKLNLTKVSCYFIKLFFLGALSVGYISLCSAQGSQTVVVRDLQQSTSQHPPNNAQSRSTSFSKNHYIVKLREPSVSAYLHKSVKTAKQAGVAGSNSKKSTLSSAVAKSYQKGLLVSRC